MASPLSTLGVCNLATPLISGTGKATDFKFGGYTYRANPNKSPFKNFGENGVWAYPGTAQIFGYPLLSQERVKLRTSNFVGTFIGSIGTKITMKMLGNVAVGVVRESRKFRASIYRVHRAVIFATAQLSCSIE